MATCFKFVGKNLTMRHRSAHGEKQRILLHRLQGSCLARERRWRRRPRGEGQEGGREEGASQAGEGSHQQAQARAIRRGNSRILRAVWGHSWC